MARKDYLNDPTAPRPNSIVVACSAFVQDDNGRILMIRRTDNDYYTIPGGRLEPGETLTECAVRETKEETGFEVEVTGLVGLYSNPLHVIEYSDGEVRQEFSICFRGKLMRGRPATSDESSEVLWCPPVDVDELSVHSSTRLRIKHGLSGRSIYYT